MNFKIKTTVELNEKELVKALTHGTLVGKKIESIEWLYKSVCVDTGRGNGTYKREVTGVVIEFKG
jgi:hypothetical protein